MQALLQDLRYRVRTLLKHKGFTLIAVLTLALGISANTAMFSVLNTYLFRALPYPHSTQLVRVFCTSPHSQSWPHSAPSLAAQREQHTVFQHLATYNGISPNLAEEGEPAERMSGYAVSADFFPALGVQPALGRGFTAEEDQPGANQVVVISDRFWQRRFSGDPNIVGRTLRLDGENVKIIGVMPLRLRSSVAVGNSGCVASSGTDAGAAEAVQQTSCLLLRLNLSNLHCQYM